MRFSDWVYRRPDYSGIKLNLSVCADKISNARSYAELRGAWLDAKRETEEMEFLEEIIFIRYLCGTDYENASKEVALQNTEDPSVYTLRDRCDAAAERSPYLSELRVEFGKNIFKKKSVSVAAESAESLALRSEELRLRTEYRRLSSAANIDDSVLFRCFAELTEIRNRLAASLGYDGYRQLGYEAVDRQDYGEAELAQFRSQVKKLITPMCADIRKNGVIPEFPSALPRTSDELISAIRVMFHGLSDDAGRYIDEITETELYDLDIRAAKRENAFSCCMIPCEQLPFIIGNYRGGSKEAGYVVHEFGHGFAFYSAARTQPLYELHRASPSINEIHSKTMELFMYPYLEVFVGESAQSYVSCHLFNQLDTLPYRCAVDEFEHILYGLTDLSEKNISGIWADILESYMPWYTDEKRALGQPITWPRQTHIAEKPFYYIEYNLAQMGAFEFFKKMKENPRAAWEDYVKLCSAGGSGSYKELLTLAGLRAPFSENAVADICVPVFDELSKHISEA